MHLMPTGLDPSASPGGFHRTRLRTLMQTRRSFSKYSDGKEELLKRLYKRTFSRSNNLIFAE